jgi:hypothetical protein
MATVRFAVLNTVPAGFCRKVHLLAPGGRLADLATIKRDQLPEVGLSPTNMEAIQSFADWHKRGISPSLGLLLWYLESIQLDSGAFLRTEDAPDPSVGVAIRFLQLAGQSGVHRAECESVDRAASWLEMQISDEGLLHMPVSGVVDYGMLARAVRSLASVRGSQPVGSTVERAGEALTEVSIGPSIWSTYPRGEPSTGATSLVFSAIAACPDVFDLNPDPDWLLSARNGDGGWGEHSSSTSRIDNTFWAYRGCLAAGHRPEGRVSPSLLTGAHGSGYDIAMTERLRVLVGVHPNDDVTPLAMKSLCDDADRYAETALYGLALSERLQARLVDDVEAANGERLPVRTPDFLRREPPLYDQLADVSAQSWWVRLVEAAARARVAEASIGWLAGISAAIAIIGNELVDGLQALPLLPLTIVLVVEVLISLAWLAARQSGHRRLSGVPHFGLALVFALLLVGLITAPSEVQMPATPIAVLALLLALIIEIVAVATDKADLLNRLDDD